MMSIFKQRRYFIVEEKDVTTILNVINRQFIFAYRIGSYDRDEESTTKWFIAYRCTDKKYGKIVKDLLEIGKFELVVSPKEQVNLYYKVKL